MVSFPANTPLNSKRRSSGLVLISSLTLLLGILGELPFYAPEPLAAAGATLGNLRRLINRAPFLLFSLHDGEGPTRPNPAPAFFWQAGLANSWPVSICHEIIRIPERCHGAISLAVSIFNAGENKVLRSARIQPILLLVVKRLYASASYVIPTNAN